MERVLDEFITILDNSAEVKELKKFKKQVLIKPEIITLLEQMNPDNYYHIREELFKYEEFLNYQKAMNELNILILKINNKLKHLNRIQGCHKVNA